VRSVAASLRYTRPHVPNQLELATTLPRCLLHNTQVTSHTPHSVLVGGTGAPWHSPTSRTQNRCIHFVPRILRVLNARGFSINLGGKIQFFVRPAADYCRQRTGS